MKKFKLKHTGNRIEKNIKNLQAILFYENMIFDAMKTLNPIYKDYVQWDFYKTENGSFLMLPPTEILNTKIEVRKLSDASETITMSVEALAICINYMVLESLSYRLEDRHLQDLMIKLRSCMYDHQEAGSMFNFLD